MAYFVSFVLYAPFRGYQQTTIVQTQRTNVSKLEDDIDALFTLPLTEFTGARNALAARLKKEGRGDEAERVKLLGKPSISAWTVNQLYWQHRKAFDQLIVTAKRFQPAQKSRATGKAVDMRDSLDARREALVQLSDLAKEVLQDAGHNPTQDTMRRITTTLEALLAYALLPDGPTAGRLTQDVEPPGFESLASLMAGAGTIGFTRPRAAANARPEPAATVEAREAKQLREANITAAKLSLQQAKRSLADARARAQSLESAHKKAYSEAKEAEKYKREAEERLKKATSASEDAARRAQSVGTEVEEAANAVEDAKRAIEKATRELELLFKS